jgi:ssDNA-binding Zn-finger/Zn-ribbon topoisomerase 1
VSEEQKHKHVQNIKMNYKPPQLINEKVRSDKSLIEPESTIQVCPKCGARLVFRTAKKGTNTGKQFWGCSNFPKCRYIR